MKLNKQQIIIAISSTVVLGTAIFLIINRNKKIAKEKEINDILDATVKDPSQTNAGQVIIPKTELDKLPDGKFPIKIGEKSKKVYAMQQALNKTYGTSIDLDGKYGESTFVTLCTNLWNKGILSSYEASCIEHGIPSVDNPTGRTRRMITQKDYDAVVSHHNFTGEDDKVVYEIPNIPNAVVISSANC